MLSQRNLNDTTIVSYVSKKYKIVIQLSTFTKSVKVSDINDKKPQIILDYNATKGAVDTLDQLLLELIRAKRKQKDEL